jgi:hypothetical protein
MHGQNHIKSEVKLISNQWLGTLKILNIPGFHADFHTYKLSNNIRMCQRYITYILALVHTPIRRTHTCMTNITYFETYHQDLHIKSIWFSEL